MNERLIVPMACILALLMIIGGYVVTQVGSPTQVSLTAAGVAWVTEQIKLEQTYPGMTLIACGTILGACAILKSR